MLLAQRVGGRLQDLAQQAGRRHAIKPSGQDHGGPGRGPCGHRLEVRGHQLRNGCPVRENAECRRHIHTTVQPQSRVARDSLPFRTAGERLGVDVHQMHLAMGGKQDRQVQIVGITGPQDAEPRSPRRRLAGERGREASPMLGKPLPLVSAGRVAVDLTPAEVILS